ncbi:unnamed protein product [Fraxinus pennsylvanica]|uniref:NAC domain-containing protein n=1 Tax=Fraxinus pennsylvanica TaxID=56036 RepID=A0AAD2E7W0_9LAMI|nr:unnamed protein product [Fraxinus pennsylvanica]
MAIKQTYYAPTDLKYYYSQVNDDEYFKNIFPGYVFHPTDAQLIVDYLIPKIKNETLPRSLIKVVNNVYDLNPENLEDDYGVNRAEEWLFYTPRDRENETENIRDGVAVDGYWQVIGDDETIVDNDETLGFRKTLEFYKGNPPRGDKTSWIMHEIRANDDQQSVADDTKLWIDHQMSDLEPLEDESSQLLVGRALSLEFPNHSFLQLYLNQQNLMPVEDVLDATC